VRFKLISGAFPATYFEKIAHKTQDGTALDLMKWRVNGAEMSGLALVGHPANFCADRRAFRRNLACYARKSPVSCFLDLAYSLQKALYRRPEANGIHKIAAAFKRHNSAS
jgi:hypothetical protein